MATACVALHLAAGGAAGAEWMDGYLRAARAALGDDLLAATALEDPTGGAPGVLVAAEGRAAEVRRLAAGAGHDGFAVRVAGADPALFGDGPAGWLQVVVDLATSPVPFDDPSVLGVFHQQLAWYFPLLGRRHLACGALFHDGVRALGSLVAFDADDATMAEWLASADPWRRLGRAYLFRLPRGLLRASPPSPGPGTQRGGTLICDHVESQPEPGTGTRR